MRVHRGEIENGVDVRRCRTQVSDECSEPAHGRGRSPLVPRLPVDRGHRRPRCAVGPRTMTRAAASTPPFRRVLVANRGEIAVRSFCTLRDLGIESVAIYSDADRYALHVRHADHAFAIGGELPAESYLRQDVVLDVAKRAGAEAIHP